MKLFGNAKPRKQLPPQEAPAQIPTPEQVKEFELSGQEYDEKLKLLLNDEELVSEEQIAPAQAKEMGKPVNTDYHIVHDPIRGTKVRYDTEEDDDEDDDRAGLSGVVKGSLLFLTSIVILVVVLFGVYANLV